MTERAKKELRKGFEKESHAIFSDMIRQAETAELKGQPRFLWHGTALRILRAWRAHKIALGLDETLLDHYKIDPPVFLDGWIEDGEAMHKGAGHFSIFATFYDDDEARRACGILERTARATATTDTDETGRRGGLEAQCRSRLTDLAQFRLYEIERDREAREEGKKFFNP